MPKKTGISPVNYASALNYYHHNKKHKKTLNYGIDTLVLDLMYEKHELHCLLNAWKSYTTNSNNFYFSLSNFQGLQLQATIQHTKYASQLNISIDTDEFPSFPAMQIYYNRQSKELKGQTKITLYGLFFRYCQLAKIDRRKLSQDIANELLINKSLLDLRIMRLDYKCDILDIAPQDVYSRIKDYNKRKRTLIGTREQSYVKGGLLETIYIGSKKSHFAFCRIYNKSLDTDKKQKNSFYFDYPNPTTRIEWQFGTQFIGNLTLANLMWKIAKYVGQKSLFEGNYFIANQYNKDNIIKVEEYRETTLNRLKKLVQNGVPINSIVLEALDYQNNHRRKILSSKFLFSIPIEKKLLFSNPIEWTT